MCFSIKPRCPNKKSPKHSGFTQYILANLQCTVILCKCTAGEVGLIWGGEVELLGES